MNQIQFSNPQDVEIFIKIGDEERFVGNAVALNLVDQKDSQPVYSYKRHSYHMVVEGAVRTVGTLVTRKTVIDNVLLMAKNIYEERYKAQIAELPSGDSELIRIFNLNQSEIEILKAAAEGPSVSKVIPDDILDITDEMSIKLSFNGQEKKEIFNVVFLSKETSIQATDDEIIESYQFMGNKKKLEDDSLLITEDGFYLDKDELDDIWKNEFYSQSDLFIQERHSEKITNGENLLIEHVISVEDGDTISVKLKGVSDNINVRLFGLDAPETEKRHRFGCEEDAAQINGGQPSILIPSQTYGEDSKRWLIDSMGLSEKNGTFTMSSKLSLEIKGSDVYGRRIGVIKKHYKNEIIDLNHESVKLGKSHALQGSFGSTKYIASERDAKKAHIGLWALSGSNITPSQYRQNNKNKCSCQKGAINE